MKLERSVPLFIFGFALIWYLALIIRFPTHGAIGTDPATYVQMALELAVRGTVVHEFPLFTKLFEQGFSWDAFITPGYHIVRETGFVAPNFAFGFPLLLAIGYRVFGENALYWTTPLLGALSLVMTFALANELWRGNAAARRERTPFRSVARAGDTANGNAAARRERTPFRSVARAGDTANGNAAARRERTPFRSVARAGDTASGNAAASVPYTTRRYWIGALAVLLLATTPKQIQLALVPMSDVPTQLFCVLAMWCALRVGRLSLRGSAAMITSLATKQSPSRAREIASSPSALLAMTEHMAFAALCGLALGMAYLTRHSALAMFAPLAIVARRWGETKRERAVLVGIALAVFVSTILPDGLYRANVLGSVFAVESPESAQTNFYDAPRQFLQMLVALFSVTGFGPLILFAPIGWWILAREKNRFAAFVLAAWILAFMLLHAPLKLTGVFENNLRYLIPAYPALALSASVAVIWIGERAWNAAYAARTRFTKQSLLVYTIALLGIIALAIALRSVVNSERFAARAYGWMSETARADFEQLNAQLPRDAVIGTSDQMAGATMLYAQRDIFRPDNFLEPAREFPQFLQQMKNENRAVFLLGDWNCASVANASEKLPNWLADDSFAQTGISISDLPYECPQGLYQLNGE